jgi:Beta-ketoacyl synthase, N-terminal domain/Beta-ketoacyl synthase, C-terminal domain
MSMIWRKRTTSFFFASVKPTVGSAPLSLVRDDYPQTLAHVLVTGSRSYEQVHVVAWDCLSAAGDAAATWSACTIGRCTLQHNPAIGWHGRVNTPHSADRHLDLARMTSQQPWAAIAAKSGTLAFGASTSKGDLAAWDAALAGDPSSFIRAWPGQLTPRLAAALGLPIYRPISVAAACSTGLYALLDAADTIENGHCTRALVGAVDTSLSPWLLAGFKAMGVLCGDTPPQSFATPTGFAPAEGAAFFALGNDGPWRLVGGVRLGDAGHETEFRDPQTLRQAFASLWRMLPGPDLIITHGTGTALGDAYETAGLLQGPWNKSMRLACKPSIGHGLGASAAVELAAGLQAPVRRLWKIGLGFGGHLAGVALERTSY